MPTSTLPIPTEQGEIAIGVCRLSRRNKRPPHHHVKSSSRLHSVSGERRWRIVAARLWWASGEGWTIPHLVFETDPLRLKARGMAGSGAELRSTASDFLLQQDVSAAKETRRVDQGVAGRTAGTFDSNFEPRQWSSYGGLAGMFADQKRSRAPGGSSREKKQGNWIVRTAASLPRSPKGQCRRGRFSQASTSEARSPACGL